MSERMFRVSTLLSEDSDSIALYPAAQAGVKIPMISDDVDRMANEPFQKVFGIHNSSFSEIRS